MALRQAVVALLWAGSAKLVLLVCPRGLGLCQVTCVHCPLSCYARAPVCGGGLQSQRLVPVVLWLAPQRMSSLADSSATFESRAKQYGLPVAALESLRKDGIATYSSLLFSVASSPGSVDDARLETLRKKHLGATPTSGEVAAFSRLIFEAGTFVVAELRSSVTGEDDTSRKLTPQERASRLSAMRAKLGEWPVAGAFEPSNQLIDMCFSMIADGCIKHIPPSKCSSKEQETASEKRDDNLFRLEAATLRRAAKPVALKVDLSSELRVYQALSRRGVALEVANVASFAVHEKYIRGLFEHLHRSPPPNYVAPGLDQLLQADRALWQRVAATVPSLPATDVVRAVDAAIVQHCDGSAVAFHVMPLPKERKRPFEASSEEKGKGGRINRKGDGKGGKAESRGPKGAPKGGAKGVPKGPKESPLRHRFHHS